MILTPCADYRSRWEWVRTGLQHAIRRSGTRYIPEDVFLALSASTAWLYLIADKGFVVLQQQRDVDGIDLHVWWLWCPGLAEIQDEFVAALDELARACKCKRITGNSPRGFGLVGHFTEVCKMFEREVPDAV